MFMVEANAVAKRKTSCAVTRLIAALGRRPLRLKHRWRQQNARQTPPEANHNEAETTGSIAEMIVPLGKQRREIPT